MSLYKRNGIYHMDFTIRGKRVRRSTNQTDKYLAGLVENDEKTKARQSGVESILRTAPLLKDFAEQFLQWVEDAQTIGEDAKRFYKSGWRLLSVTKLPDKRMDQITNDDTETIKFPGGNFNANLALRTLRRMFTKAKERKLFFGDIPTFELRQEWGRNIAMTEADAQTISNKMEAGDARDVLDIMRSATPMRPKECYSLRWEYLRFSDSVYQNPRGKSNAARRPILMFDLAMAVLKRRHLEQDRPSSGWVFPSKKSNSGHVPSIYDQFTKARDAAGLPKEMVLYTIRHGRATDLAKVATLKELMQVGGWSDAKTALGYQHPSTEDLQARLAASKITGRVQ